MEEDFSKQVLIREILAGGSSLDGLTVRIGGWVRKGRIQDRGNLAFLEVNDGSCPDNLQVIVASTLASLNQLKITGTSVHLEGVLKLPPQTKNTVDLKADKKQTIELKAQKIIDVGTVDPKGKYPITKSKLSLEYLRDYPHLRPRTQIISAIARIRSSLTFAIHTFFQTENFICVDTSSITTNDCEGAGEMFQVTTLISDAEKLEKELIKNPPPSESDLEAAKLNMEGKREIIVQLKSANASKSEITAAVSEFTKAKENLSKLEERSKLKPGIPKKDGKIDYTQDFFARQAFLTVSGQLEVEAYASAMSKVYTFGPTFRAEHSHTSRHLAEFYMVEPEIAFADLKDDMDWAEKFVKFLCKWLLDKCPEDMKVMAEEVDETAINRLKKVASSNFIRITYTEAVTILKKASKEKTFENKVEWGIDLASEHERYLTEVEFESPVIVYNYPKEIKAFYMRINDDNKTVAAMDVLVPKVGELIGGSQREERYDVLKERILAAGSLEPYEWYLDLRRHGTVKHSGFGMGFERMILFATGIDNIRDVIPFPRYPGRADL